MKNRNLVVTLFFLVSFSTYGQYLDDRKKDAIKFNIFGVFVGQFQAAYERALNEQLSVQLAAGILTGSSEGTINGVPWFKGKRTGFIVIPEARFYFKESLKGGYVGTFFRYRQAKWDVNDLLNSPDEEWSYERTRTTIGGGALLGYHLFLGDLFVIDVFIGPQYKSISKKTDYDNEEANRLEEPTTISLSNLDKDGTSVRFGINIGYAF